MLIKIGERPPILLSYADDLKITGPGRVAFVTLGGSVAHGTATADSDIDVKGFYIPDEDYYLGTDSELPDTHIGKLETGSTQIESEFHEIRKFARLALSCNPTVIETLFTDRKYHVRSSAWASILIKERHCFLSKRAFKSFNGYAKQQVHRMVTGEEPTRKMGAKRKALIEKHGYNTKNAAHVIRLLMMGLELAEKGTITVERPEKELLLNIKQGKWSLLEVSGLAGRLFNQFREIEDSGKAQLPDQPDTARVSYLVREIVKEQLELRRV